MTKIKGIIIGLVLIIICGVVGVVLYLNNSGKNENNIAIEDGISREQIIYMIDSADSAIKDGTVKSFEELEEYLNTIQTSGLSAQNETMIRAEVVYMLVNRYFESELGAVDIKTTDVKFSDAKDGGNIAEQQKFIENGVAKDYWKSYELTYSLTNPDGGLPTDLYKALVVAKQVGILDNTETRWDEAVTRSEAVEFIINALKNDDSVATFNYNQGEISGYEVTEKEETTTDNSVNSTHDNVTLGEDDYKGDDPYDISGKPGKTDFTGLDPKADSGLVPGPDGIAENGMGADIDNDGIITNEEAEFWQSLDDILGVDTTQTTDNSGSTQTPPGGGSYTPGPTGEQGGYVPGATGNVDGTIKSDKHIEWGTGDYSGLENFVVQ